MDGIAINDDLPVTEAEMNKEMQDEPPSDRPKLGEEVNTARPCENTGNVDVRDKTLLRHLERSKS